MGHGRGQRGTRGGGPQLEVRDEGDRADALGRSQAHAANLGSHLIHPGHGRAAEDGGSHVVGVPLHLGADLEDLLAAENLGVADERARQRHASDDGARRGT